MDVIIPAWNEEETIGAVVYTWQSAGFSPLVVIDPATSDATASVARSLTHRVVQSELHGKGECIRFGLQLVLSDWVAFCDADLVGLNPGHIFAMEQRINSYNMVIGIPDIPPYVSEKVASAWPYVSGERMMPTHWARRIEMTGYAMEVQMNITAFKESLPVDYVELKGVTAPYRMTPQRIADRERDRKKLQDWMLGNG